MGPHDFPSSSPTPGPRPPAARRERLLAVEEALLESRSCEEVEADLSARFGVSSRTVRSDLRCVYRKWSKEDAEVFKQERLLVPRRLRMLSRKCEEAGAFRACLAAETTLARIVGILPAPFPIEPAAPAAIAGEAERRYREAVAILRSMQPEERRRTILAALDGLVGPLNGNGAGGRGGLPPLG